MRTFKFLFFENKLLFLVKSTPWKHLAQVKFEETYFKNWPLRYWDIESDSVKMPTMLFVKIFFEESTLSNGDKLQANSADSILLCILRNVV